MSEEANGHKESTRPRRGSALKALLVGGGSALLVAVVAYLLAPGLFQSFENQLYDMRVRFAADTREPPDPDSGIYVVRIDDSALEKYGRFAQWPRTMHGQLASQLGEWSAAAIFFDLLFTQEDRDPAVDRALAEGFRQAGVVYSAISLTDRESYFFESRIPKDELIRNAPRSVFRVEEIPGSETLPDLAETKILEGPAPLITRACLGLGLVNVFGDDDGVIRRQPLLLRHGDLVIPTVSFRLFLDLLGINSDEVHLVPGETLHAGPYSFPVDRNGCFLIHWYPPDRGPYRELSYYDVLEARIPTEAMAGAVCLIGPTAAALEDLKPTSAGLAVPGVKIHTTLLANLARLDTVGMMGRWQGILLAVLLGALAAFFAVRFRTTGGVLLSVGLLLLLLVAGFYAFAAWSYWIELFRPALGLTVAYAGTMAYRYMTEERQKRVIKGAFQQYVPPAVVDEMLLYPEKLRLGGERREISVLFADIQGFTGFSEQLDPEELTHFLNRFLTEMTRRIFEEQGTVDKYIGDAIMALFGAPLSFDDHAHRAVEAGLGMRREVERLRAEWGGQVSASFDMKIGINTGAVVVGNMGSDMRFDYTAIGDNVNLAARLETLTRKYGVGLLISESTREAVGEEFMVRELDLVRVKGKTRPARVFEVIGHTGSVEDTPEARERIRTFNEGLGHYRARAWDQALACFSSLDGDPAAEVFAERCEHLKDEPPGSEWDGVWVMKTK